MRSLLDTQMVKVLNTELRTENIKPAMLRESKGRDIAQSLGSDAPEPSWWGDTIPIMNLPKTHELKCGREKNAEVKNPKSVSVGKQRGLVT